MKSRYVALSFIVLCLMCSCSSEPDSLNTSGIGNPPGGNSIREENMGDANSSPTVVDASGVVFDYPDLNIRRIKTGASTSLIIQSTSSQYLEAYTAAQDLLASSSFIYSSLDSGGDFNSPTFDISYIYSDDAYYLNLEINRYTESDLELLGLDTSFYLYSIECSFADSSSLEEDISGMALYGYTADATYIDQINEWIETIDSSFDI